MSLSSIGLGVPVTAAHQLVFGIDAVPVARAQQLADRYSASFTARISTPDEAGWAVAAPDRLGAVLGMKEAAIKAMGGRPEPFTWQQISTGASRLEVRFEDPAAIAAIGTNDSAGWPAAVAQVLWGFTAGLDLTMITVTTCEASGPSLERLSAQLPGAGSVLGAGCYATRDEHIFAAVCFWREGHEDE